MVTVNCMSLVMIRWASTSIVYPMDDPVGEILVCEAGHLESSEQPLQFNCVTT